MIPRQREAPGETGLHKRPVSFRSRNGLIAAIYPRIVLPALPHVFGIEKLTRTKNMKNTLLLSAFLLVGTAASQAVTVIVDNYFTQQNGSTTGAVGDFAVQSFTPTIAGLGTNDTVATHTPYTGATATVSLNSVSFIRATSGTSDNAALGGPVLTFVHVYLGDGNDGTYVGSSTNSINTDAAAGLSTMTWNFNNLALASPGSEYAFVFTNSATSAPGTANYHARLQVARHSGGTFISSYSGGDADNDINGNSPTAFDSRFTVSMTAIPEPSSALLGGLGMLLLLRRRR